MDLWYPAATKDELPNGGVFTGGPAKGVLHSTEGASYAGARGAYVKNNSAPHFTVSVERGPFQCWQHVPLNRASRSLQNAAGGVETNRDSVIQIEIVGRAVEMPNMGVPMLTGLRSLMVWIETQTGISAVAPPFLPYPQSYGASSVRMSHRQWDAFGAWCGHQHVPENTHGDPGAIPITALLKRFPTQRVAPMFDPALKIVAALDAPAGGVWLLAPDGAIYAFAGAQYKGGMNTAEMAPHFAGRTAARLEPNGAGYTIVATSGERYNFG